MHTTGDMHADPNFLDFGAFMERREVAAQEFASGDIEALGRIATRHPPASFFGPGGETKLGPNKVFEAYEQGARQFAPDGDTHFEVFQSASSDGLAYWVGLQHSTMHVADSDTPRHIVQRVTELFRREKGEWKLIHRHADSLESSR